MSVAEDHVLQARHNEEFLAEIDADRFPDWSVTTCFYAAVHWLEATIQSAESLMIRPRNGERMRVKRPISTESLKDEVGESSPHRVRKHLLMENKSYFNCARAYNSLMEESHASRYSCYRGITAERVSACRVHLDAVKSGVLPRLNLPE